MKKIFRDYAELISDESLEGYLVRKVISGINAEQTGITITLEKEITGGIIGVDILYDPTFEETPFMISDEYILHVFEDEPVSNKYVVTKVRKLVQDLKANYEACLDLCGEDDEVNTLPAKQMYEDAQGILAYLEQSA